MATEEEERKAKAERAKKLLAQRQKKTKAAASSAVATPNLTASPSLTETDAGTASARTSLSVDDRSELAPPPKGEARRKKVVKPESDGGDDAAAEIKVDAVNGLSEDKSGTGVEATISEEAPAATGANPDTQTSSNLQETVSLLIAERADLQSQLASRDAEIAASAAEKKLLEEGRAIIAKLEAEKGEQDARIAALESDAEGVKVLHSELSDARKEADTLRQKQKESDESLRAEKAKRTAEADGDKEKVAGLERSLERAREREGGLEAEVARLRQREVELKASAETRLTDTDSLRKQVATLTEDLERSRTDHTSLKAELDSLSTTHSTLQSAHTSLSSDIDTLRSTHSAQSEQLQKAETSLSTAQSELEHATTSLFTERKRAETSEKKKQALQTENGVLVAQLEEVRGKVASVMEEKADLASELDSAKGQIRRSDVDQTVKNLEAELQASANRIHTLTRQLADLQAAYASLQKDRVASTSNIGSPHHPDPPPISRTSSVNRTVDAILPANVRHKRQVSLTALKARMGSSFIKGGLDVLAENSAGERRQFGDEIMFCCPACEGDLITL